MFIINEGFVIDHFPHKYSHINFEFVKCAPSAVTQWNYLTSVTYFQLKYKRIQVSSPEKTFYFINSSFVHVLLFFNSTNSTLFILPLPLPLQAIDTTERYCATSTFNLFTLFTITLKYKSAYCCFILTWFSFFKYCKTSRYEILYLLN